jgi:hypothetical protein
MPLKLIALTKLKTCGLTFRIDRKSKTYVAILISNPNPGLVAVCCASSGGICAEIA